MANTPYLPSYVFDNERLWIAFPDETLGNKVTVWKYENGVWSVVGQPGFSVGHAHSIILKMSNGIPWVAYEDWSLGSAGVVKKFDGNSWQNVGNQVFNGDPHDQMDFAVSNGIPYIVHADSTTQNRPRVLKFDGTNWTPIGSLLSAAPTNFVKLAIDAAVQEPYLLTEDHSPSFWGLSAMHFDGTSWNYVGARGFIPNYWNLEFVINDGTPYVGYEFSAFGGGVSVQVFSPVSDTNEPLVSGISFQIQPNPIAEGILQIQFNNATSSELLSQIFDQNGRLLQEKSFPVGVGVASHRFDLLDIPPGVYALRLRSKRGKEWITQQFVVAQ